VLGGAQSLHTNSLDEVLALPSDRAVRIALRTQQVIAFETGVPDVIDPLGGAYFVESLTDRVEAEAEALIGRLEEMGEGSVLDGVLAGVETGFQQAQIADAAFEEQRRFDAGELVRVGVTRFVEEEAAPIDLLEIPMATETGKVERLGAHRRSRDDTAVADALDGLEVGARAPDVNLIPLLVGCARTGCTEGEIVARLQGVFGTFDEIVRI
jgi:methylmalonyl-CoA mutase N-terminal domain/subunit